MNRTLRRPRYADVVGTLALIVAMSGTAYAAHALPKDSVGAKQVKTGAIRSAELRDGQVSAVDLAPSSVGLGQLANDAVSGAKILDGTVTGADLGTGSVAGSQVADDSLTLGDLVGADVSGAMSFSLAANGCGNLSLGIEGAEVGQVVLFSFTGAVAVPTAIVFGGNRVTAADTVVVRACNVSGSAFTVSGLGFRLVTFG